MTAKRIFTIGYEGTTQSELIAALQAAGVARVIDVRAVPLSRKPGFSKNVLAAGLGEAGIDYVHLKGSARRRRDARRRARKKWAAFERIYRSARHARVRARGGPDDRARRREALGPALLRARPQAVPPDAAARGGDAGWETVDLLAYLILDQSNCRRQIQAQKRR